MDTLKKELYQMIDEIPEKELPVVKKFLRFILVEGRDPVLEAFLKAPPDDEPLSEKEMLDIEKSEKEIEEGEILSHEEAYREIFGE